MEEIGIRIKIELPKGTADVWKKIQDYFNKNKFKISLTGDIESTLNNVKRQVEDVKKILDKVSLSGFDKQTQTFKDGKLVKQVTTFTDALGRTRKEIEQIDSAMSKLVSTDITQDNTKIIKAEQQMQEALLKTEISRREESEKFEKAQAKRINKELDNKYVTNLKAEKEMEDALLQTEQKRRIENEKLAQAQAKAVNKNQELKYKNELKAQEDLISGQQKLELFTKQSNIEVTKFRQQYAGLYDTDRLNSYIAKVNNLNTSFKNNKISAKELTFQTQLLNKEFGQIKADSIAKGINAANKSSISFIESLKLVAYKFSTWLLMGNVLMGFYHQIGMGITFIKDLDSAFVDLKKVTNETKDVYASFAVEASEIGRQLAKTTVSVITATTAFSKMGFALSEAKELAKTALITSNVGDIDVQKSSEYLISSVKAYNIAAEDSIRITDILNAVQNQHATTIEVLGEGLKRTANSMQLAGASIEQTVSMITAVQAVSQRGGEVIGNALRTIAFRIRGIDEESGELLPSLEGDLERVGVRLKSADGGFRNIYEVLKDLSGVWKTLDSYTQADLLEKLAGKRQGEILATLLSNFAESELALEHAINSLGSAAKENETYMQSVEAKVNQFQVSLEKMYQTFLNSDALIGFIHVGQGLINVFSSMTNTIGGFNTLLLIFGSVLLMTSNKFRTFMVTLDTKIINMFGLSITSLYRKLIILTGGATTARIAITALYGAMSLGIGLIAGFAIEGLLKLITKLGESAKEQKEYFDQLSSSVRDLSQEVSSNENLISTYKELTGKINKTAEEKTKLVDITNKLAQAIPGTVEQYDLEGNAISLSSEKLEEYIKLKKEELDLKRRGLETEFYTNFDKETKDLQSKKERLEEITRMIASSQEQIKTLTSSEDYDDSYFKQDMVRMAKERIAAWSIEQQKLTGSMGELTSKTKSQAKAFLTLSENLKGLSDTDVNNIVDTLFKSVDKVDNNAIKSFLQTISTSKEASDAIKNINKEMNEYRAGNVSTAETQQYVNEQIEALREILTNLNVDPQMIEIFMAAFNTDNIQKVTKDVDTFKNTLIGLQETLSSTSSKIQSLNKALEEYNDEGKFNLKTIVDLSKTYPELLGFLDDEAGLRKELTKLIEKEEETQKSAYAKMLIQSEEFFNNKIKGNAEVVNYLNDLYGIDLKNFKSLAEAKLVVEQGLIKQLAEKWSHYYDVVSGGLTDLYMEDKIAAQEYAGTQYGAQYEAGMKEFESLYDKVKNVGKNFEKIVLENSNIDFSSLNIDSSKSGGSSDEVKNLLSEYEQSLEKIEARLQQSKAVQELYSKSSKEYRDELTKQIDLLKLKQDILHQEADAARALIASGNLTLEQQNELNLDIIQFGTEWSKVQKEINSSLDEFNTSKIEQLIDNLSSPIDRLDNKIKSLKKQLTALEDAPLELKQQKTTELADAYVEYISLIQQAIQKLKVESATLIENSDAWKTNQEQIQKWQDVLESLNDSYISDLKQAADDIIDIYKDMYEKQKDAKLDAIDDELEAEERRHDRIMDNYEDEYEAYEKIINAKLKEIDKKSDDRSYEQDLTDLQKERQELVNKINLLSMDDSVEGKQRRLELEQQLLAKNREIEDLQYEHTTDLRKDSLEEQLDAYKEEIEAKQEAEEEKFEATKRRLEEEKEEWEDYYQDLINDERKFAKIREQIMSGNFNNIQSDFKTFQSFMMSNLSTIGQSIYNNLTDKFNEAVRAGKEAYSLAGKTTTSGGITTGSTSGTSPTATFSAGSYVNENGTAIMQSRSLASALGTSVEWDQANQQVIIGGKRFTPVKNVDGTTWVSIRQVAEALGHRVDWNASNGTISVFDSGGVVGNKTPSGIYDIVSKFLNVDGGHQIVEAMKNEIMMAPQNVPNFIGNLKNLVSSVNPVVATGGNTYQLNFNIDNLNGTKKDANNLATTVITKLKSIGAV